MNNLNEPDNELRKYSKLNIVKYILIILLSISTISLFVLNNNLQNQYNNLSNQFLKLSEENSKLESEQKTLKDDIKSLSSENNKFKEEISDLNANIKTLEKYKVDYEKLQNDYKKLEKEYKSIKEQGSKIKSSSSKSTEKSKNGSNTGTKVNTDNLNDIKSSPAFSSNTSNEQQETVYWVSGGEVYHSTPNCRTLKRSSNIKSGTIAQSGKGRPCKVCY